MNIKKLMLAAATLLAAFAFSACSPEVGSKEWCEQMKEKPKGDWSTNEATAYAKHCIL